MSKPKQVDRIRRDCEPLKEGQVLREVTIVRRTPIKATKVLVAKPRASAAAIGAAFGEGPAPIIEQVHYKEKVVGREIEVFRWVKPDAEGGFVPR